MESLTVSLSQCEDTLKQQAKKTADLEAQRSAVDEKLVQHVSDGDRVLLLRALLAKNHFVEGLGD